MLIVQKHLQAVTKALTGKEIAPIGELLAKIEHLRTANERLRKAFISIIVETDDADAWLGLDSDVVAKQLDKIIKIAEQALAEDK